MKFNALSWFAILLISLSVACKREEVKSLEPFHLSEVRLLDSPFKEAMKADADYMLQLDVDRLLAPYLKEAGLEPRGENYTNWENTGLDGHIGGHYLSALAKMYAATGDERMLERLTYMLNELQRAQDANGNGYLSGVPQGKKMWEEVREGKIEAGSFSLNKKWVPLYNIHKIYAGLCDAWIYAHSEQAKEMLIKLSDWAITLVQNLNEEQLQDMLRSEHGGLNEVFAELSHITGENKYLLLAERFSQRAILDPLVLHEDQLTGMHANTQIPKIIGFKRVAMINANEDWNKAADFFWHKVVEERSVSIGGNSVREHFHPTDDYSSMIESEQGPETCNTYNMLKLTKQLFLTNPMSEYMDYYERALYNHILSTEDPVNGGFVYFTPMRPGHYRVYSQPETSFWCCVGSGLENHTQYGDLIYAHTTNDIFVNLFIPSALSWEEKGVKLTQETNFPFDETTTLIINTAKKSKFNLKIRKPKWITNNDLLLKVNGTTHRVNAEENGYVSIGRTWEDGDKVEITLPMTTSVEQLPDGANYYSFLHGPIVLAMNCGNENQDGLLADDSRGGHIASGEKYPLNQLPTLISSSDSLLKLIHLIDLKSLKFELASNHSSDSVKYVLQAFFQLHKTRYAIYFKCNSPLEFEAAQEQLAQEQMAQKILDEATIDVVFPGEQQPESDHFILSENSNTGIHRGKHWRDASGWFSYQLKNSNNEARRLRVMYFAGDENRSFSLLVNQEKIADIQLEKQDGDDFYTVDYELPSNLVNQSKNSLEVKFQASKNSVAGGIYEVRLMK